MDVYAGQAFSPLTVLKIPAAIGSGLGVGIVILDALLFRGIGVFISVSKTRLNAKERLFCLLMI